MKKDFDAFFRHNLACQNKLDSLRDIIKRNFGIDDFWHVTLHENGMVANVSTHYEQWGYFWDQNHYTNLNFLIAPSKLRDSTFHLQNDTKFTEITDSFKHIYPQHHPFIMIRKEGKDKAHIFGFAAREHRPNLPAFYQNNLPILTSFLTHYLSSIPRSRDEHMINLAALKGRNCYYNGSYVDEVDPTPFFKQIGIDPCFLNAAKQLSKRERQVLDGCLNHKNAPEIAQELGLSARTIQFYLDNAKNKLGICSREELFAHADVLKVLLHS
ncbi:MAG: helix-turn-helix transcriptional regulator [Verrucomicrobia bacterium]|nr:helix-turn-helix transcriptional regulator [Verrucomicrobiota bacterium]MBS0637725.1 helix-turn-helix transcriptional regulator [Verrucomicrobiota bacterium]